MKDARRTLSVDAELDTLRAATELIRVVLDTHLHHGFSCEYEERQALSGASAAASLIGERLLSLCRSMRGSLDPRLLVCAHNETVGTPHPSDDGDLRLRSWSLLEIAAHADREIRYVEAQHERKKRRR